MCYLDVSKVSILGSHYYASVNLSLTWLFTWICWQLFWFRRFVFREWKYLEGSQSAEYGKIVKILSAPSKYFEVQMRKVQSQVYHILHSVVQVRPGAHTNVKFFSVLLRNHGLHMKSLIEQIPIENDVIISLIRKLKPNMANGSDGIFRHMLILCDNPVTLVIIYQLPYTPISGNLLKQLWYTKKVTNN